MQDVVSGQKALSLSPSRLRSRDFWIITLLTVAVCALTARLSLWQVHRGQEKMQLMAQLQQISLRPAWGNAQVLGLAQSSGEALPPSWMFPEVQKLARGLPQVEDLYHPVLLTGHWLPEHAIYVENRPMQGLTGYWVFIPFALVDSTHSANSANSQKVLLVQRGWLPRSINGTKDLPALQTPAGDFVLHAQLQGEPSKLPELGRAPAPAQHGPDVRLNVDLAQLRASTQLPLLPFTAREVDAGQKDGLLRHWDAPNLNVAMHQGYALQWAAMCAAALALYLWFQWIKPWRTALKGRGE